MGPGGAGTFDLACFCGCRPLLDLLSPERNLHLGWDSRVSWSPCPEATPRRRPGHSHVHMHWGSWAIRVPRLWAGARCDLPRDPQAGEALVVSVWSGNREAGPCEETVVGLCFHATLEHFCWLPCPQTKVLGVLLLFPKRARGMGTPLCPILQLLCPWVLLFIF